MPENLRRRRSSSINAPSDFYSITDSPLKHGAYYASIKTKTWFSSAFTLNVDVYGEHRGVSYGVFNTKNMIVFPIITAFINDSLNIFSGKIALEGKAGHFLSERLDQGLLIYNMDVQGVQAALRLKSWKVSYTLYGDLYNGIGLNIDDLHSVSINRSIDKKKSAFFGTSLYAIAPPGSKKSENLVWSIVGKKNIDRTEVYFQAGYRIKNNKDVNFKKGFKEQLAILLGHTLNFESKIFDLKNQTEFRFYGQSFNRNNYTEGVKYRENVTQRPLYANTIGEYLYPLRKFDTPFSQWAIFTEYKGMNVAGLSLFGNFRYKHSDKTEIDLIYDLNQLFVGRDTVLSVKSNNNFLYPFFTLAFSYKPVTNMKASLIVTNKGMNLDLSYPTLYLYERPYLGIKMSMLF